MIDVSPFSIVLMFLAGATGGSLGALLGIGGGPFLVPFLVLVAGLPFRVAAGISLATVIATSTVVSANAASRQVINLRLGIVLEVATTAGGLTGGLTALMLPPSILRVLFAAVMIVIALVMLGRLNRRNVILDAEIDPGLLGGRYHEDESGGVVTYRVKRLGVALGMSFVAGNLSTILGIGGGVLKVPVLNAWCGIPLRAAAATSAFMIGVTATAGAIIYYARGEIVPALAAGAVLGVLAGSRLGMMMGARARAKWLKLLLALLLLAVSVLMLTRTG